jgi:hypothetical protein
MTRSKKDPILPIKTFSFEDEGQQYIAEIWEHYPEEGKRGTHRRSRRAQIFDLALNAIAESYYFSNNPARKELTKRSLYNPKFNKELLAKIQELCKAKRIGVARTTVYKVAADVKKALKAMDNAIAANANQPSD